MQDHDETERNNLNHRQEKNVRMGTLQIEQGILKELMIEKDPIQENNICNFPTFLHKIGQLCTPCNIFCPCLCCCCSRPLFQQVTSRYGILQQFGKFQKVLSPGLHVINPISQSVIEVSQQTKLIQFQQSVFSKDNVQFLIVTAIFYRIYKPIDFVYKLGADVQNLELCVTQIAQGTLRNIIGENILQHLIQKRDLVGKKLMDQMNQSINIWGIYIQNCAIKDIRIPPQIANILSNVAKTKRLMEAMIISYKAEVQVGKLIKETSQILNTKAAFQIRYLNLIGDIIQNQNEKVIIIKTSLTD